MIADHLTGIEQFGADLWKMADERPKPDAERQPRRVVSRCLAHF